MWETSQLSHRYWENSELDFSAISKSATQALYSSKELQACVLANSNIQQTFVYVSVSSVQRSDFLPFNELFYNEGVHWMILWVQKTSGATIDKNWAKTSTRSTYCGKNHYKASLQGISDKSKHAKNSSPVMSLDQFLQISIPQLLAVKITQ